MMNQPRSPVTDLRQTTLSRKDRECIEGGEPDPKPILETRTIFTLPTTYFSALHPLPQNISPIRSPAHSTGSISYSLATRLFLVYEGPS